MCDDILDSGYERNYLHILQSLNRPVQHISVKNWFANLNHLFSVGAISVDCLVDDLKSQCISDYEEDLLVIPQQFPHHIDKIEQSALSALIFE